MKLFVVTAPGLAELTAGEITALGIRAEVVPGGVSFEGGLPEIYRTNLHLRTASRVLVRLGEFRAASFSELRRQAAGLAWDQFFVPGQPAALHVTCHKSKLYHSDAVAERVAGAIGDRLGKPAPLQKGAAEDESPKASDAQLVIVRFLNDVCTISIDSSGELLHRRGYRLASAKAPLRETLAAGMLLASGWDRASPLVDPFCGSGTIPIEAARAAAGIPPGWERRFAFIDWPGFDAAAWQALRAEVRVNPQDLPPILGSDRDAGAVEMAQANAARAGVGAHIAFSQRAVSAVEPPAGPGWVVTNPPYGLRVSEGKDLRNLYAQFGKVLRLKFPGWRVVILCSDLRLLGQVGIKLDTSMRLVNGGVSVIVARGTVVDR